MDSSSSSQKKIRRALRSRRLPVVLAQPKINCPKVEQRKAKSKNKAGADATRKNFEVASKISENCPAPDLIPKTAGIGNLAAPCTSAAKDNVKMSTHGVFSVPASEIPTGETQSSKNKGVSQDLNHCEVEMSDSSGSDVDENSQAVVLSKNLSQAITEFLPEDPDEDIRDETLKHEVERESHDQEMETNASEESEAEEGSFVKHVLHEYGKDIGSLYEKTSNIESDLKAIKKLLKTQPPQHCIYRSISSRLKQKSDFSLLPKFPLVKTSHVRKMEFNLLGDEAYLEQLIHKLASYGGNSINGMVINIFKKVFSTRLKTKYCWKGTKGTKNGRPKSAFKTYTGIRDAFWSAVKVHFEDCTESMMDREIKLRLNQAQKDYDRERAQNIV